MTKQTWISFRNCAQALTWIHKTVNICKLADLTLKRLITYFPKLQMRSNKKVSLNRSTNFDLKQLPSTSCVKKTNESSQKNLQKGNKRRLSTIESRWKLIFLILTIERKWASYFMISIMTLDSKEMKIFQTILTDNESSREDQLHLILL